MDQATRWTVLTREGKGQYSLWRHSTAAEKLHFGLQGVLWPTQGRRNEVFTMRRTHPFSWRPTPNAAQLLDEAQLPLQRIGAVVREPGVATLAAELALQILDVAIPQFDLLAVEQAHGGGHRRRRLGAGARLRPRRLPTLGRDLAAVAKGAGELRPKTVSVLCQALCLGGSADLDLGQAGSEGVALPFEHCDRPLERRIPTAARNRSIRAHAHVLTRHLLHRALLCHALLLVRCAGLGGGQTGSESITLPLEERDGLLDFRILRQAPVGAHAHILARSPQGRALLLLHERFRARGTVDRRALLLLAFEALNGEHLRLSDLLAGLVDDAEPMLQEDAAKGFLHVVSGSVPEGLASRVLLGRARGQHDHGQL
mmetsp:Transcript_10025/g.29149  ORF Transcript_10025/g.29149 Transcript_10025/m.29149 type:complete len:370 (-) Transcript_10025:78-1187(-)